MAEAVADKPKRQSRARQKTPPEATPMDSHATFFKKMAQYKEEDWGARVKVYLYRVEPVIDRTRSGEKKYIMSYAEPISEDRVLADHGSGRYKAILTFQKPGAEQGNEVDSTFLDIMNPRFPPKVVLGDWIDDARNKKWAWAKDQLEEAERKKNAPVAAQESLVETMRAVNEIQESAVERARASAAPPVDPLAIVRGVFDLMPKPAPASEIPMFQAVMTMMTQQSQQQTQILLAQIAASQAESLSLRTELKEMRMQPPQNTGMSVVKELIGEFKTILPEIKDLLPFGESRPRNMPWWAGLLEKTVEAAGPVIPMVVGQLMANANAKRAAEQPQNGAPRPQAALSAGAITAPTSAPTTTLGPQIDLDGPLLSMLDAGRNGEDLADFLNTAYGPDGVRLYDGLCQMGEQGLIQLIQSRPIWDRLGHHQVKIPEFVKQFIEYGKDDADDGSQVDESGQPKKLEVI